jgi:hypothetical protein
VPQMLAAAGGELVPAMSFPPAASTRPSTASPDLPAAVPGTLMPMLSRSQRGELELARHRAEKAAAGRKAKVPRPVKEQLMDYDDGDDSDLDLSKLNAEERESLISATLANLDDGKDAKRLKRWAHALGMHSILCAVGQGRQLNGFLRKQHTRKWFSLCAVGCERSRHELCLFHH